MTIGQRVMKFKGGLFPGALHYGQVIETFPCGLYVRVRWELTGRETTEAISEIRESKLKAERTKR